MDGIDRIEFALGPGTPVIQLRRALPVISEAVSIDGAGKQSPRVVIDGGAPVANRALNYGVDSQSMYWLPPGETDGRQKPFAVRSGSFR